MSSTMTLVERNRRFAGDFAAADLPILPKMRAVLLACGDARVDPAHVFGLEPGECVVIRNNGGRVTRAVIDEIAALAFVVARMDGGTPGPFELILMQHTQCGAERFADPGVQQAIKERLGVDVSESAIADHELSLREDVERLRTAPGVPGYIVVSGLLYDTRSGRVREVISPAPLGSLAP